MVCVYRSGGGFRKGGGLSACGSCGLRDAFEQRAWPERFYFDEILAGILRLVVHTNGNRVEVVVDEHDGAAMHRFNGLGIHHPAAAVVDISWIGKSRKCKCRAERLVCMAEDDRNLFGHVSTQLQQRLLT